MVSVSFGAEGALFAFSGYDFPASSFCTVASVFYMVTEHQKHHLRTSCFRAGEHSVMVGLAGTLVLVPISIINCGSALAGASGTVLTLDFQDCRCQAFQMKIDDKTSDSLNICYRIYYFEVQCNVHRLSHGLVLISKTVLCGTMWRHHNMATSNTVACA